jgi:hypothetical protein
MIKTTPFLNTQAARLFLGDNTFNGHSYITDTYSGGEMMDYYTAERCVRTLFEAEALGINTFVPLADPFSLRVIRQYRNEGGTMQIIFQSYPAIDLPTNLWQMMQYNPLGIYLQGGTSDLLIEENKLDELHNSLEQIRSTGVKVGYCTHDPENLLRMEHEGQVDFYMACAYNARRTRRGEKSGFVTGKSKEALVFYPGDPPLMYEAIRKVSKPCIAFKIYAGGQIFYNKKEEEIPAIAETALREAYDNIKPTDVICLAVFQKYKNELKENTALVQKVLH